MIFKTIKRYIYEKYIVYLYCNMPFLKQWKAKNNPHNINKLMIGLDIQHSPAWVNKFNVGLEKVPDCRINQLQYYIQENFSHNPDTNDSAISNM